MEEREIYLLIIGFFRNQNNTIENEILTDWITSSSDNEQTFEEIKTIWLSIKRPNESVSAPSLSKLKDKINKESLRKVKTRKLNLIKSISLAACLILITSFVYFSFLSKNNLAKVYVAVTKVGEIKTIILNDGSKVLLGPKSLLSYPESFSGNQRIIELVGEAYLEVSKNEHQPFIVKTPGLSINVTGTKFNVNAAKNQFITTVSLFEGKVEVDVSDDNTYTLKPGQELSFNRNNFQLFQGKLDSVKVIGWMTKTLIFSNVKLSEVALKLENMYGVKLVFANQATADIRLYAQFKNDKLNDVLEIICSTGNLIYNKIGNKIYISGK